MYFTTLVASAAAFFGAAQANYVAYDTGYDNGARPLTDLSCSDGPNGLITKYHWNTQGQVSGFPYIAAMQGATWNSPLCGTCHSLTYNGVTIYVVAVDAAYNGGFTTSVDALNALTGGNAVAFGHVDAVVAQVAPSKCGLPF